MLHAGCKHTHKCTSAAVKLAHNLDLPEPGPKHNTLPGQSMSLLQHQLHGHDLRCGCLAVCVCVVVAAVAVAVGGVCQTFPGTSKTA